MKVPKIYSIILERMLDECCDGSILVRRARRVLTYIFRIPKNEVGSIFKEMKEMGLIIFENHKKIHVIGSQ